MADRSFVAVLLTMLAGASIWAIHFTIIYGFTSVACTRGLGTGVVPLTVAVATGVAALAALVVMVRFLRPVGPGAPDEDHSRTADFIRWITAAVAGLAMVVMILEGLTAALVPACA
jgi:hypothetical protein